MASKLKHGFIEFHGAIIPGPTTPWRVEFWWRLPRVIRFYLRERLYHKPWFGAKWFYHIMRRDRAR